jgi:hypothetical protein
MTPSEKKWCLVGPKRMYIFDCRKAKKLIPVNKVEMSRAVAGPRVSRLPRRMIRVALWR